MGRIMLCSDKALGLPFAPCFSGEPKVSKQPIRTSSGRRSAPRSQSLGQRSNVADNSVDIRAWAQMLVERGNRLFEQAERERAALTGQSRRSRGKESRFGAKPR